MTMQGPVQLERFACFCGSTEYKPVWTGNGESPWSVVCKSCGCCFLETFYNADAIDPPEEEAYVDVGMHETVEPLDVRSVSVVCPTCGKECKGAVGLSSHIRFNHKGGK